MKTEAPPVAKAHWVRVRPNGERTTITAEIGQPYQMEEGCWGTPVALHGLDGRLSDICGVDSLQSLSLALQLVRRRLASLVAGGDHILFTEGGDVPVQAYFAGTHEH